MHNNILCKAVKRSRYGLGIFTKDEIEKFEKQVTQNNIDGKQKLFAKCVINGVNVYLKPKEIVRQLLATRLMDFYGNSKDSIKFDYQIGTEAQKGKADIIVFKDVGTAAIEEGPELVVDIASPYLLKGKRRLQSFCNATGAKFGIWGDGDKIAYYEMDEKSATLKQIDDIPTSPSIVCYTLDEKSELRDSFSSRTGRGLEEFGNSSRGKDIGKAGRALDIFNISYQDDKIKRMMRMLDLAERVMPVLDLTERMTPEAEIYNSLTGVPDNTEMLSPPNDIVPKNEITQLDKSTNELLHNKQLFEQNQMEYSQLYELMTASTLPISESVEIAQRAFSEIENELQPFRGMFEDIKRTCESWKNAFKGLKETVSTADSVLSGIENFATSEAIAYNDLKNVIEPWNNAHKELTGAVLSEMKRALNSVSTVHEDWKKAYVEPWKNTFKGLVEASSVADSFLHEIEEAVNPDFITGKELGSTIRPWNAAFKGFAKSASIVDSLVMQLGEVSSFDAIIHENLKGLSDDNFGLKLGIDEELRIELKSILSGHTYRYSKFYESFKGNEVELLSFPLEAFALPGESLFLSTHFFKVISDDEGEEEPEEKPEEDNQKKFKIIEESNRKSLESSLNELDPKFLEPLKGARQALSSSHSDRFRHYAASMMMLINYIILRLAPDERVKQWVNEDKRHSKGELTHRVRLLFITRKVNHGAFKDFFFFDIGSTLTLISVLDKGARSLENPFDENQLRCLSVKTESVIKELLYIANLPGPSPRHNVEETGEATQSIHIDQEGRILVKSNDVETSMAKPLDGEKTLRPKRSLKEALITCCQQLQGRAMSTKDDENSRNDWIAQLLDKDGFRVKDQTRWGRSATGKSPGEIDIKIENEHGEAEAIIEAFNLKCLDRTVVENHLIKLFNYDSSGLKTNFILVYSESNDFQGLWEKYLKYIPEIDFKFKLLSAPEEEDTDFAEIKLALARHERQKREINVYHIFINMPPR